VGAYSGLTPPKLSSNSTVAAGLPGAVHEIVAAFQYLFIYYNHDHKAGFQFASTTKPFSQCDSSTSTNVDCLDPRDVIDLSTLTWATIQSTVSGCPNGQYSGLLYQCKQWSATLVGSLNGQVVIDFLSVTATHPIQISTVAGEYANVQPGGQKIDVTISYPWAQRKSTGANPLVGLAVWSAAMAFTDPIIEPPKISYVTQGLIASFGWNPMSFVYPAGNKANIQRSPVFYQTFAGSSVANFDCGGIAWCSGLQNRKMNYESSGWTSNLVFFSWNTISVGDIIMWDPNNEVVNLCFRTAVSLSTGVLLLVFYWLF